MTIGAMRPPAPGLRCMGSSNRSCFILGWLTGAVFGRPPKYDQGENNMLTVESYSVAVAMCVVTMLCWGSWANTQKLATREWRFQLFYWDYAFGVFLLALMLAFTLGSSGSGGRSFATDLMQAEAK